MAAAMAGTAHDVSAERPAQRADVLTRPGAVVRTVGELLVLGTRSQGSGSGSGSHRRHWGCLCSPWTTGMSILMLLLLLLLASRASRIGITKVDADCGGDGICKVGTEGAATLVGWEGKGTGFEDW